MPEVSAVRIGVQLHPQSTTVAALLAAARDADAAGVDSIWVWDHFFAPLYGTPDDDHFECYTLLSAIAAQTSSARIGALVTCDSYRNPHLLADMARTIDHISGGRFTLGMGSGWFERDYVEYGFEFGTAIERLHRLRDDLPVIRQRLAALQPPPIGSMPILVGGTGEKVTLPMIARHADGWNGFGRPDEVERLNGILDAACADVGRDPGDIERTVTIDVGDLGLIAEYAGVGVDHLIVMCPAPFDLAPVIAALADRDAR